jgi:hypothetical protein
MVANMNCVKNTLFPTTMFNFFKNKKNYPAFATLQSFTNKDLYFVRIASWDWLDEQRITITDPHNPRVFTLDPWPQVVFLEANGQLTIAETIYQLADMYSGEIPAELDATFISEIKKLVIYGIIEFSETKRAPLPAFNLPQSRQDKAG